MKIDRPIVWFSNATLVYINCNKHIGMCVDKQLIFNQNVRDREPQRETKGFEFLQTD